MTKKNQMVFLPLMALGNESQNEFLFGVLEDLLQDLGFWSIICVISHVTLRYQFWNFDKSTPESRPENTLNIKKKIYQKKFWGSSSSASFYLLSCRFGPI